MSGVKLFADDTFLFSIFNCSIASASVSNSYLLKIKHFNGRYRLIQTVINKRKELYFQKDQFIVHPPYLPLYSNNVIVKLKYTQKHLCLQVDSELSFSEYTNNKISKVTIAIKLLRTLRTIFPRRSLLTIKNHS